MSAEIEAHEGPVYAMYAYPAPDESGMCLLTGGGDGKVKTWDAEVLYALVTHILLVVNLGDIRATSTAGEVYLVHQWW